MATAPEAAEGKPKKSKAKLFIILGVVLLLVVGGGVGALMYMKKQQAAHAEEEDADGHGEGQTKAVARDPKAKPVFLPLEQFTVNLADRDADRYAQINVTLELINEKKSDTVKSFMPIIRSNLLMVLGHKLAAEMLSKEGQIALAEEIRLEVAKAMGLKPPKSLKDEGDSISPVIAVHFQNFIVQ